MSAAKTAAAPKPRARAATKPPPAPEPDVVVAFDLDAAKAARAEAVGDPFTFSLAGKVYSIPPAREWPIESLDHMAAGRIRAAMMLLLADQWGDFAAANTDLGDLMDVFRAMSAWSGMYPGE